MIEDKQHNELSDANFTVDQLNESDAELLNLLAAEDDCSAILQNIASNEQFENLINNSDLSRQPLIGNADVVDSSGVILKQSENVNTETFRCHECGKIYLKKKDLRNHLVSHTVSRKLFCSLCNKTFKRKYELTVHKRSHEKPNFQCDICSKMFIHKSHLTCHRRKHLHDYVEYCKECNKGFVSRAAYRNHLNVHHNKIFHICDVCGVKLSSISALNEHKTVHLPGYGVERKHICDTCGKSYLRARNLRSHLKYHQQPNR